MENLAFLNEWWVDFQSDKNLNLYNPRGLWMNLRQHCERLRSELIGGPLQQTPLICSEEYRSLRKQLRLIPRRAHVGWNSLQPMISAGRALDKVVKQYLQRGGRASVTYDELEKMFIRRRFRANFPEFCDLYDVMSLAEKYLLVLDRVVAEGQRTLEHPLFYIVLRNYDTLRSLIEIHRGKHADAYALWKIDQVRNRIIVLAELAECLQPDLEDLTIDDMVKIRAAFNLLRAGLRSEEFRLASEACREVW